MFYIVKWKPRGISEAIAFSRRFPSVTEAILQAFVILDRRPADIWIEDQAGVKVVAAAQIAECCHPV